MCYVSLFYSASGNFMIFLPNDVETTRDILLTSNSKLIATEQQTETNDNNIECEAVLDNSIRSKISEIEPRSETNQKLSENRKDSKQDEKKNEDINQNSKRYFE